MSGGRGLSNEQLLTMHVSSPLLYQAVLLWDANLIDASAASKVSSNYGPHAENSMWSTHYAGEILCQVLCCFIRFEYAYVSALFYAVNHPTPRWCCFTWETITVQCIALCDVGLCWSKWITWCHGGRCLFYTFSSRILGSNLTNCVSINEYLTVICYNLLWHGQSKWHGCGR